MNFFSAFQWEVEKLSQLRELYLHDLSPRGQKIMRAYQAAGKIKSINKFDEIDFVEAVMWHEDKTGRPISDEEADKMLAKAKNTSGGDISPSGRWIPWPWNRPKIQLPGLRK